MDEVIKTRATKGRRGNLLEKMSKSYITTLLPFIIFEPLNTMVTFSTRCMHLFLEIGLLLSNCIHLEIKIYLSFYETIFKNPYLFVKFIHLLHNIFAFFIIYQSF